MESTLSLKDFLLILKQHIILIISITLLGLITTALITYFLLTPMYESSTLLLVNQSQNEEKSGLGEDLSGRDFINTYSVIITSPRILEEVVKELSLNGTHHILRNRVIVESERESQVFSITVKYEDPELAMNIANTIASVFQREIYDILNVDNVSILSVAEQPSSPISPKPVLNLTIAFVVSFMFSIGVTFLLEFLDNRIKTEEDIEKILEVPLLGSVMCIDGANGKFNMANQSFLEDSIYLQKKTNSEGGEEVGT